MNKDSKSGRTQGKAHTKRLEEDTTGHTTWVYEKDCCATNPPQRRSAPTGDEEHKSSNREIPAKNPRPRNTANCLTERDDSQDPVQHAPIPKINTHRVSKPETSNNHTIEGLTHT